MRVRVGLAFGAMKTGDTILGQAIPDGIGIGRIIALVLYLNHGDFRLGNSEATEVGIKVRVVEAAAQQDDADGLTASGTGTGKLVCLGNSSRGSVRCQAACLLAIAAFP